MNVGEKLQTLRKSKGLSQEQLAEALAVSRQAVSKWELNESMPDTQNIIQLSLLFDVSTDFLLFDDNEQTDPLAAYNSQLERKQTQQRMQMLFAGTIGISTIGLIFSIVAWFTWQTVFTVAIGLIIGICGIIVFETMLAKYHPTDAAYRRRSFYSINIWLIAPVPLFWLVELAMRMAPRPIGSFVELAVMIIAYLLLCSLVSIMLMRKNLRRNAK